MRQFIKMLGCYFNGHDYHWHFAERQLDAQFFQCRNCHKIKWDPKNK